MPDSQQLPPKDALPENLRRLLGEYRIKLWRAKILEAILAGVIGLALSFLIVFLFDRLIATTATARLLILLSGTSLAVIFAPIWLRRWVWGHRDERSIAQLISQKYPDLGDRLLGIIELQEQEEMSDSMSPRLRRAAMEIVSSQAEKQGLSDALPKNWLSKAVILTAILLFGIATAFFLAPAAGINAFKRWAMPLTPTERYTFTKIASPPSKLVVAHGETFELRLMLTEDTEWRPSTAEARCGGGPPFTVPLLGDGYSFSLPAQFSSSELSVTVGDFRHVIRVEPVLRPTIHNATANIRYPSYLQQSDLTVDLKTGVVTAVAGSTVQVELSASRPLSSALLGPVAHVRADDERDQQASLADNSPIQGYTAPLAIQGSFASSSLLSVWAKTYDVPFSWSDEFGLSGENPFRLRIEAIEDAPPVTYIQGVEKQKVILPEETIDFDVAAQDDFGLTELGIEWYGEASPTTKSDLLVKGELKLLVGNPTARQLSHLTAFCPKVHNIGPQKLICRAYTNDYSPERKRIYSEPITLFILTRDEHAQFLKSQFDRIVGELEDATRQEQNAYEENQRVERNAPEDLQKQENRTKLQEQQRREQENMERMKDLHQRMDKLLKDAARNGEIDKDVMKKMSESMKSLSELSEQDMPKVEEKLSDAQQQNSTPQQTKKDVQDAIQEQKKVVEKMYQTLADARDANKNLEAATFASRFKRAASEESSFVAELSNTNQRSEEGLEFDRVDPAVQSQIHNIDLRQTVNLNEIRWIEEDLGSFYTRTNQEIYKKIRDEMRGIDQLASITYSLEKIRALLQDNLTIQFRNGATYWSDRLNTWAKQIEDAKDSGSGGGGDGGASDSADQDFEFMLRVMKMIQKQQDIRANTRALEELNRSIKLP